ncbi:MAG: sugar phosphate nucleotidyltransferase [Pacificimonas sp.]|jgi:mannose-1-phosphate guanylyltransferase/mannose-1-phosphate guanylyltransferase/mannose-6-phosphate isomerase|nr:sugar phosphate nucleotidyltransferase [Pacificimonas sp.]
MTKRDSFIVPVILSGGSGTRLWPLSTSAAPKQLLALAGDRPMIAETAMRTPAGRFAEPVIVTAASQATQVRTALRGTPATVIEEPAARNTAPAIALAAHLVAASGPETLMLVMPSDHLIADVDAFHAAIEAGAALATDGWLVTFGIEPDRAETGYGYIEAGEALSDRGRTAAAFHEKPDRETAERYLADGGFYWNAGIFLMRADRYLEALAAENAAIAGAAEAAFAERTETADGFVAGKDAFERSPGQSIDYAVMEPAKRKAVVPVSMGWSDIGSYEALHAVLPQDDRGNVQRGDVVVENVSGSLIWSTGPLVTAAGVEDLVIVATPRAVTVVPRTRSQDIKLIVEALKAAERDEL